MKIRVMLLVGSNGKVSACAEGDLEWGDLADNIADYGTGEVIDPDATARYILTTEIPLPEVAEMAAEVSIQHSGEGRQTP